MTWLDGGPAAHARESATEDDLLGPVLSRENGKAGPKSDDGGGGGGGNKSAPTDITLTNDVIDENASGGTVVGILGAEDSDRNESFTFQLLDDAGGRFRVDGDQLVVADGAELDFEAAASHTVMIQVTDKFGGTYSESIEISLNDLDEGPTGSPPNDIALSDSSVAENSADGTVVGLLSATDPDGDGPYTFSLLENAGGRFAVSGNELVVADGALLDFESANAHEVTIDVADAAGNHYSQAFTITLTDVDETSAPSEPTSLEVPDHVLEGLLIDGTADTQYRWNADDAMGSAVTVTYSFLDAVPDYYGDTAAERDGFEPFTAAQQDAVHAVLGIISEFTNVSFVETTDEVGDLAFGTADLSHGTAWAYYPSLTSPVGGDVWLNNTVEANDDMTPGGDGFQTLLHEIGHALGMKHPFESPELPADEQNRKYTVMAYSEHPEMGGGEPSGYMHYDIAALQYLYGANMTASAGDDVYDLSNVDGMLTAIWDSGGHDVLDASGATSDVVLNLNQASFSTAGTVYGWYPATDNIALAYGTLIEEARGGAGDDVIVGNDGDNRLAGGGGADSFVFLDSWGHDVIADFEDGLDRIDLSALSIGFDDLSVDNSDGSALVGFGGDTILLAGLAASQVDDSDFLFGATV